jgi:hypothetical protein
MGRALASSSLAPWLVRPSQDSAKLIRRKPLKHDRLPRSLPDRHKGVDQMTVCVAAISSDGPCIVCVADKALTFDNYIQWDSDCTKIRYLRGGAVVMFAWNDDVHATCLMQALAEFNNYAGERGAIISGLKAIGSDVFQEM